MPGRKPAEAFREFIEPLEVAVACLGRAKITTSAGGTTSPDGVHSWSLNDFEGMAFPDGVLFRASMQYEFVQDSGTWRVTSRGYAYHLLKGGVEVWLMHYHPHGKSHEKRPHLHLPMIGPGHFIGERMSFEQAVAWVIESGVSPALETWDAILQDGHERHVEFRTW